MKFDYKSYSNHLESENERLNATIDELDDSITWWTNRFNAVQRDYAELKIKIDKAIEYIKDHYNLATKEEGVAFFILRDNLLDILGDKENGL